MDCFYARAHSALVADEVLESEHWTYVRLEVAFRAHYLGLGAGKTDALLERLLNDEDVDTVTRAKVVVAYQKSLDRTCERARPVFNTPVVSQMSCHFGSIACGS